MISSDIAGLEWAHELPTVNFFPSEDVQTLYGAMKAFLDGKCVSDADVCTSRKHIEAVLSLRVWVEHIMRHYGL